MLVNILSYDIADYEFDGTLREPGLVEVALSQIDRFCKLCEKNSSAGPYTIITSPSDQGICYQSEHPIEKDFRDHIVFQSTNIADSIKGTSGMSPLMIQSPCNVEYCSLEDEFSIKINSHTYFTLNLSLPTNITRWYCANANIEMDRLVHIPFGVNAPTQDEFAQPIQESMLNNIRTPVKDASVTFSPYVMYVNYSDHTLERTALKEYYRKEYWVHTVDKPINEAGVPHSTFMNDMRGCGFVLCPPGVGLDSFRIWEALYCGTIPIVRADYWNEWMEKLGVVRVKSLFDLSPRLLKACSLIRTEPKENLRLLSQEYWQERIREGT